MTEVLGGLANRLVVERKADGRCVYDEAAKAELVVLCGQPGASVSKLARQAGVNANQLWRWVREHARRRPDATAGSAAAKREVFVAMPVAVAASLPASSGGDVGCRDRMTLRARLPNGVVVDVGDLNALQTAEVIAALGRVRCSVSTKG